MRLYVIFAQSVVGKYAGIVLEILRVRKEYSLFLRKGCLRLGLCKPYLFYISDLTLAYFTCLRMDELVVSHSVSLIMLAFN